MHWKIKLDLIKPWRNSLKEILHLIIHNIWDIKINHILLIMIQITQIDKIILN